MNALTRSLTFASLLGLLACNNPPEPRTAPPETGGSAKGDLGPPQGAPLQEELPEPPNVPAPIHRDYPAKVVVNVEVREMEGELADGVRYTFWTFGGSVPGRFIRVRQGDTVEFHLANAPGNKMPHNIDLHAVTGPGGGAASTFTAPGHESQFTFKALNQGLFVYHCATAPVGMHIANGMYGLILVEPPEGLPPVDREYYVMQGDFYTTGKTGEKGAQAFDLDKAVDEKPTYVVFNGREDSLTGEHALRALAGERVRLFIGNGGPNLVSSFHVIGEVFDHVYSEGGTRAQENVATTLIPAGGAAMVDFKVEVPGTYSLVDHSIFRAFNKGAIAQIKVMGQDRNDVFTAKQRELPYAGDPNAPKVMAGLKPELSLSAPEAAAPAAPAAPAKKLTMAEQMNAGKQIFTSICQACHQADANGMPKLIPPLAGSDFLMANKLRAAEIVTHGLSGPVTVKGVTYNSQMPPLTQLSDEDVANVLTFVRNSFGNKGEAVKPEEVTKVRAGGAELGMR